MEPETSAEETLEEDVRLNESFYIIRPHSDSELAQCHGFNLKKDFEVRTVAYISYRPVCLIKIEAFCIKK